MSEVYGAHAVDLDMIIAEKACSGVRYLSYEGRLCNLEERSPCDSPRDCDRLILMARDLIHISQSSSTLPSSLT